MLLYIDTEGSGNDEISSTRYSPVSLDQESTAEHHITSTSEEEQTKVPLSHKVNELYEDSNPGEVLFLQESSPSGCSSFLSNSNVECFTSPPYLNPNPYSSTPNLSFLTPVIHRENTVRHSSKDRRFCQQNWDNSNLHNLPYLTPLTDEPVIIQENSIFKNRTQTDNREAPSTKNRSMFVPVDVTPAQRKQVHFYTSDQESSTAEHRVKNFSEENQTNASTPAREQYDDSSVYAPRNKDTLVTSIAGCSTPRSYYVNQHFHYPTPTLGSTTTATHQENLVGFSTKDQRIPGMKDSPLQYLPCSTSINTDTKTTIPSQTTPIGSNVDNHNNSAQVSWSMFPPLVVTPAQQRRVQFASSVPLQKIKVIVNNAVVPMKETSNLNTSIPGTSFPNGSSMDFSKYVSPPKQEHAVVITEGIVSDQHEYCKEEAIRLVQSSSKTVTTYPVHSLIHTQDGTTNASENSNNQANPKFTTRKRKQSVASWKTSVRKKFNGRCTHHCRCRTVIRKVKIRDAETQTS